MSMNEFNPIGEIEKSEVILVDGKWPSFHDAEVHFISYWKGDIRPEEDVWIGPTIEIDFELCALKDPFFTKIAFYDCTSIDLNVDNPDNMMYDLVFSYEERGTYTNGKPLPPYIVVEFKDTFGLHMSFKCMQIRIIERYEHVRSKVT